MNNKVLFSLSFSAIFLLGTSLNAQVKKLRDVKFQVQSQDVSTKNLKHMKYNIDKASESSETSNRCATYGWRGIVYTLISSSDTASRNEIDPTDTAINVACEALLKFFAFSQDEQDDMDTRKSVLQYIPNSIIIAYNSGMIAYDRGESYEKIKRYFEYVIKLMPYDEEEIAKNNNVSAEKAAYFTWSAAYRDSLVSEELYYLNNLAENPRYYNSDVFVRLSQIYSERKEYDKAMAILDKGIAKIPQKNAAFLEQQINIELNRGNQEAILAKFNKAIAENPDNSNYYFSRGVTYHQLKQQDIEAMNAAFSKGARLYRHKYFFSQAYNDYAKALELEPGNFGAQNNISILLMDSANYLYKERGRFSPTDERFNSYLTSSLEVYKLALDRFELLRQSGAFSGEDMIALLGDMKLCAARLQDIDAINRFNKLIKAEKEKLRNE